MPRSADVAPTVSTQAPGWGAGVNLRDVITQLAPNEARNLENLVLNESGGVGKRLGCLNAGTFGAGADRIISSYVFFRGATAPQMLIHTSAGKLYYTANPAGNPAVWTQITTGLSTTAPMCFETFNSKVYMTNGVDLYASWDGAAYATFASAPKGKFLKLWKDTMWVTGVTGLSDRVYASNAGDAETYGVSSWVDIAKGDGDQTTGFITDGIYLGVNKRDRLFLITDPALFSNRMLDPEKGCETQFAVVEHEASIFFLSRKGICEWMSDSPSKLLSYKLDPIFTTDFLNYSALANSRAYAYQNQCGWAVPEVGSTTPTVIIEYYPRLGPLLAFGGRGVGPFVFHRFPAATFTRWRSGTLDQLYGGHNAANKLLQIFAPIGTDDGNAFASILETVAFTWDAPTLTKYLRRARFIGRGKFFVSTRIDFSSSLNKTYLVDMSSGSKVWNSDTWNSGPWGPDSLIKEKLLDMDDFGRHIQIRVSDSELTTGAARYELGSKSVTPTAGQWALYGLLLDAIQLGVRP